MRHRKRTSTRTKPRAIRAPFRFEELDAVTREWMLVEFEREEASLPYRSNRLTEVGREAFGPIMQQVITMGDEIILEEALRDPSYWNRFEPYTKGMRRVPWIAPRQLAITEFNTAYVRGLCRRLIDEGVAQCQIYRAAPAGEPRLECEHLENQLFPVQLIYAGHRARYWPEPGNPQALSIPVGYNCHHTVRRSPSENQVRRILGIVS